MKTILDRWQISAEELTKIVDENPSLRGFIFGYVSEYKARTFFDGNSEITGLKKYEDQVKGTSHFNIKEENLRLKQSHYKLILYIKKMGYGRENFNVMQVIEGKYFFQTDIQ